MGSFRYIIVAVVAVVMIMTIIIVALSWLLVPPYLSWEKNFSKLRH